MANFCALPVAVLLEVLLEKDPARRKLEGPIAKRPDSQYEAGRRSGAWVKVKLTQQQEFVVGGYTLLMIADPDLEQRQGVQPRVSRQPVARRQQG
jgi:hypothetical protein